MRCNECNHLYKSKESPGKHFCLITREYIYDPEDEIECQDHVDKKQNNRPKRFMHSKERGRGLLVLPPDKNY